MVIVSLVFHIGCSDCLLLIKYDLDYRSLIGKLGKISTSMIQGHYGDDVPSDTN